jgi:hypothetical protein
MAELVQLPDDGLILEPKLVAKTFTCNLWCVIDG